MKYFFSEQRLVFDRSDEAEKLLGGRGPLAGPRDVADEYNNRVAAGQETGHEGREMRDMKGPIQPTPRVLDGLPTDDGSRPEHGIRKKLAYIKERHFPMSNPSVYRAKGLDRYSKILDDLPEAMLRSAIAENANEEELLEAYEAHMAKLEDVLKKDLWHEDLDSWRFRDEALPSRSGENPFLTAVPMLTVQVKHKAEIDRQMREIEKYYYDRFVEVHSIGFNDYKDERLEFTKKTEFPFYREYFVNGAIIAHQTPDSMAEQYSEKLKELLRNCISEPSGKLTPESKRQLQKAEDDSPQEKSERWTKAKWRTAVDEMREIVKH